MSQGPGRADDPAARGAGFASGSRRWNRYEAVAGGGSLVLALLLFGPWYRVRVAGCPPGSCGPAYMPDLSGVGTHGYLWSVVALAAVIVVMLVLRAGHGKVRFLRWPPGRLLLAAAACANLVMVVVAFAAAGPVVGYYSLSSRSPTLDMTWDVGAWIALAAAAVAAAAACRNLMTRRAAAPVAPPPVTGTPS